MNLNKYHLIAEITFDAAHRLSNYEGKCKRIHGHTYKVFVEVSADSLNNWGAVIDFGDLKKMMNDHIDAIYDHKLLLFVDDPINKKISAALPIDDWIYWMNSNTTAENIAKEIYTEIRVILKTLTKSNVSVNKVTVYETPKNGASYQEEQI
jgi:6-pyruvoyltetrahydropterin/6-carboxytetrahydropterin synthase